MGSNLVGRYPPFDHGRQIRRSNTGNHSFYFHISPHLTTLKERTRSVFRAAAGRDAVQQANSTVYLHVLGQVGTLFMCSTFILLKYVCFANRCVTGSIGGRFSRGEESCLVNCVDRYVDTSLFVIKKVDEQGAAARSG